MPTAVDICAGTDGCTYEFQTGASCDDGDPNTQDDTCQDDGACLGELVDCPVGPCVAESISTDGACVDTYMDAGEFCDDGDLETKDDVCDGAGGCTGTPYTCPDPTICAPQVTADGVDCVTEYAPVDTDCDDGSDETNQDHCDGAGGCVGAPYDCPEPSECTPSYTKDGSGCLANHADSGAPWDDGNTETNSDQCNGAGVCSGTNYQCPAPTICIPSYTKDNDDCVPNYAGNDTTCNDGSDETNDDKCDG